MSIHLHPVPTGTTKTKDRNDVIIEEWVGGKSQKEIATEFGVNQPRVWSILRANCAVDAALGTVRTLRQRK